MIKPLFLVIENEEEEVADILNQLLSTIQIVANLFCIREREINCLYIYIYIYI